MGTLAVRRAAWSLWVMATSFFLKCKNMGDCYRFWKELFIDLHECNWLHTCSLWTHLEHQDKKSIFLWNNQKQSLFFNTWPSFYCHLGNNRLKYSVCHSTNKFIAIHFIRHYQVFPGSEWGVTMHNRKYVQFCLFNSLFDCFFPKHIPKGSELLSLLSNIPSGECVDVAHKFLLAYLNLLMVTVWTS